MVHGAGYAIDGGYDDLRREQIGDAAVDALAELCPSVRDQIVGREVLTPVDLAADYRLSGGHIHHGEHALDQLAFMRPSIECGRSATPIKGLFLGGSGSHPGGGIRCTPGVLAAKAVLAG